MVQLLRRGGGAWYIHAHALMYSLHWVDCAAVAVATIGVPVEGVIVGADRRAQALLQGVHCLVHWEVVHMPALASCKVSKRGAILIELQGDRNTLHSMHIAVQ